MTPINPIPIAMKKILLIVSLSLPCIPLTAQVEWAPIGAEWYYSNPGTYDTPLASYVKYTSTSDTLVNGKEARVIVSQSDTVVMHEANGRVYYLFNDEFRLIYDFTVQVGDTIEFEFMAMHPNSTTYDTTFSANYVVRSITPIETANGSIRKFSTTLVWDWDIPLPDYAHDHYDYLDRVGFEYGFMYRQKHTNYLLPSYLRCYADSEINFQSNWWSVQSKPCDHVQVDAQGRDTIVGKLVSWANPCITNPCLPGMEWAVRYDEVNYFLSCYGCQSPSNCLLYTSPSPRDRTRSRMPSSA